MITIADNAAPLVLHVHALDGAGFEGATLATLPVWAVDGVEVAAGNSYEAAILYIQVDATGMSATITPRRPGTALLHARAQNANSLMVEGSETLQITPGVAAALTITV